MKKTQKLFLILLTSLIIFFALPSHVSAASLEDDRTIFGENYTLESGRILDGDLNVIGGVVEIEKDAQVNGNVNVIGGLVTIDGIILGDLTAVGGTVNLNENAVIKGNLVSPASYINQDPGATVEGDQIQNWNIPWTGFNIPEFDPRGDFIRPETQIITAATRIGRGIAFSLILTALGALLLLMMPKSTQVMTTALESQPWVMLGYGALTAFVMVIGGIILSITICLIPVVILAGMAVALAGLVGWLTLGYELGKKISESLFKATWHPVLSAALGNFLLYLIAAGLDLIPCLGGFLVLIAALFGLGTTVVTLFGTKTYPHGTDKENEEKILLFEEKQADTANEWKAEEVDPSSESKITRRPIEDLGLHENDTMTLKNAGMATIDDILERFANGDEGLSALENFDQKSMQDLKDALSRLGYDIPGSSE
ncbi:MAG: polymer-forming cytoskeletal protein [Brevefilum sp.]|nr:polymer-forming cytoskeletal protein [Brevefilum sp.]MDW7753796.1 polymer-forming cytoskeletal protein [Brevefilum sp.]